MAISAVNGITAANISAINGIAKANITAINGITASFGGGGYTISDSDAQAFITATSITDDTIKQAIDELVQDLKSVSVWTKMLAVYPLVGGSASTHAVNLKSPGTYDITWNGTLTHDSNGVTSNGTSGYGNTGLNCSTVLTLNDVHLSAYSRSALTGDNAEPLGAINGTGSQRVELESLRNAAGNMVARFYDGSGNSQIVGAVTNSQGHFIATRRSSTDAEIYRNGTSIATSTNTAGGGHPNQNIFVCCRNFNGSPGNYTTHNFAFFSIGTSLTDTEAANFTTAVETFEDFLSRGVA